jgi:hypothetical protein
MMVNGIPYTYRDASRYEVPRTTLCLYLYVTRSCQYFSIYHATSSVFFVFFVFQKVEVIIDRCSTAILVRKEDGRIEENRESCHVYGKVLGRSVYVFMSRNFRFVTNVLVMLELGRSI